MKRSITAFVPFALLTQHKCAQAFADHPPPEYSDGGGSDYIIPVVLGIAFLVWHVFFRNK
jgi:hypothetical protein